MKCRAGSARPSKSTTARSPESSSKRATTEDTGDAEVSVQENSSASSASSSRAQGSGLRAPGSGLQSPGSDLRPRPTTNDQRLLLSFNHHFEILRRNYHRLVAAPVEACDQLEDVRFERRPALGVERRERF